MLSHDQSSWLPDHLLERADRMLMASGIEARMPMMDIELARFTSSLPDRYLVRLGTGKLILREVAERHLPRRTSRRRKKGFLMPTSRWLRNEMYPMTRDLLNASSRLTGFIPAPEIERILSENRSGKRDHSRLVWNMLSLEIFLQQYRLQA
jgi:asparagine synthase (glutamine-hydrolysing)